MPRKITSITIDNYRAWYGLYEPIKLPNGENLLIYGENGSDKSSFFKGIQNFFRSSIDGAPPFELNIFSILAGNTNGSINIEFTDFTPYPPTVDQYQYSVGTASSNNQQFINDTRKLNSFLDYKHMLGVHFTNPEADIVPDLFPLLIENLLGGYNLPATARHIKEEIGSIVAGLKRKSDSVFYDEARDSIPVVYGAINTLLTDILIEANRLLSTYFDNNIEILVVDFVFQIKAGRHKELDKLLRIQTRYAGQMVPNYNYFLNEARLSAIAICFYLASVLSHPPAATEYKTLFLDDIFIGLDTSNRIPLLRLINAEFTSYQIVITTYDRFWYEVAKDWFDKHMKNLWVSREMYVHKDEHISGRPPFDITISLPAESYYAKALFYLNTNYRPDYPAAANYLRKYLESIFKKYIPEVEFKNKANENIGEFPEFISLNDMIIGAKEFLDKINQSDALITLFKGHTKRLLNPLSHYDPATPIYRQELDDVVNIIPQLQAFLEDLQTNVFKLSLAQHTWLRMKFEIAIDDYIYYEVKINDQLYKYRDTISGQTTFSDPPVMSNSNYRVTAGVTVSTNKRIVNYISITDAYNQIHAFLIGQAGLAALTQEANWVSAFEYKDAAGTWFNLNTLAVWP